MDITNIKMTIWGDQPFTTRAHVEGTGSELVLMIPGLGCGAASFDRIFTTNYDREKFTLCSLNLDDHDGIYTNTGLNMVAVFGEIAAHAATSFAPKTTHIVGHSIGSAVGLLAANRLSTVETFTSVEGNLVSEDCGLITRNIAEQTFEHFEAEGFHQLHEKLHSSKRADYKQWATWLNESNPTVLHRIACSVVDWCDSGSLPGFYAGLRKHAYVFGEHSGFPTHTAAADLYKQRHKIPGSGHFPMIDNSDAFYETLWFIINPDQ